jgi:hypothetical protein
VANHVNETPATQFLKKQKVSFNEHPYDYLAHCGAQEVQCALED